MSNYNFTTLRKVLSGLLATAFIVISFSSCVDQDFDEPPNTTLPFDPAKVYTIKDIRNIIDTIPGNEYLVTEDYSLFATCTMDDKTGNIYKAAYLSDGTGAIQIFDNGQGIYQGDSIRLYLNGATLSVYQEQYQIQNVTADLNVVKISVLNETPATLVTIPEALFYLDSLQGSLIQIDSVQFLTEEVGLPYADAENLETLNRTIVDRDGNQIIVRTSGYASFANEPVSGNNGSITAILGQYGSDAQLYIRSLDEIDFQDQAFFISSQAFNDGFGTWNTISVIGNQEWEISTSYGNPAPCTTISGYENGNFANEDWLISPPMNLSEYSNKMLTFDMAMNYTGPDIELLYSSNYDGGNDPNSATWFTLNYNDPPGGSWDWFESGIVDLNNLNEPNTYIAFKFTSTSSDSATWELDNIQIFGQ